MANIMNSEGVGLNESLYDLMSPSDFANLGIDNLAYVKPESVDGEAQIFIIYAADGQMLAEAESREIADAMAIQNELRPASVH